MSRTFLPPGLMDELCVPWCTAYSLACCESCLSPVPLSCASPLLHAKMMLCRRWQSTKSQLHLSLHLPEVVFRPGLLTSLAESSRIHCIQIEKSEAMEDWEGVQW